MADAYIVGAVRTATGKKKGRLSAIHPIDLGAAVVDELVDRTGIPVDAVDDVIFGVVMQIGAQASNLGRNVSMSSKLDLAVPGTTVDRQCGSSLQAIQFGAQAVMSGTQDVIISGGVEAMSTVEMGSNVRDGLANGRGIQRVSASRFNTLAFSLVSSMGLSCSPKNTKSRVMNSMRLRYRAISERGKPRRKVISKKKLFP